MSTLPTSKPSLQTANLGELGLTSPDCHVLAEGILVWGEGGSGSGGYYVRISKTFSNYKMDRQSRSLNSRSDAQEEAELRPNSLRSSCLAEAQDYDCSCPLTQQQLIWFQGRTEKRGRGTRKSLRMTLMEHSCNALNIVLNTAHSFVSSNPHKLLQGRDWSPLMRTQNERLSNFPKITQQSRGAQSFLTTKYYS